MGQTDCCRGAIGTSFKSKRWLSLDVCGMVCVTLSFSIHIFALFVVSKHLLSTSILYKFIYGVLYVPSVALALSSLFMAWTTNPGAVPLGARPLPFEDTESEGEGNEQDRLTQGSDNLKRRRGIRRCRKCDDNFKPPRAHHDSVTGRCVVKLDHYCPWVGNAVGALNHKFFFLFILYTLIASLSCLSLILVLFIRCGYKFNTGSESDDAPNDSDDGVGGSEENRFLKNLEIIEHPNCSQIDSTQILILFVSCVVFFLFTCCMLFEQIDAIESNTSKIARMKISRGLAGSELGKVAEDFNEFFGGNSSNVSLQWFLPTPVRFPEGSKDNVMGYIWDESWPAKAFDEEVQPASSAESGSRPSDIAGLGTGSETKNPPLVLKEDETQSEPKGKVKKRGGSKKNESESGDFSFMSHMNQLV